MARAIGYIRVSTEQQAEEGVSLSAQEAKVRAYCDLYGHELVRIEADAASASSLKRDGLTRALASLDAGEADALVVVKLDRLTRSVRDLDTLLHGYFGAGGHDLVSIGEQVDTTTATGRLMLGMLMQVSQWEREVIAERTKAALQHKKARGEYVGQAPYGYRLAADGVRIEADPDEQRALDLMRELQASGMSLRGIAAALEQDGVPARGARWHATTVARATQGQYGDDKQRRRKRSQAATRARPG
jgi:DNA invertase Pin-like site-specific DNA recombinase